MTIKYDKLTSKYYLNIVFEKECLENKINLLNVVDSLAPYFDDPKQFSKAKTLISGFFDILHDDTKFEKEIAGKLDDYRVHVILFPLSFHKKSPAMVEWIMQGKDDAQKKERFEEIMLKGSTAYQTLIKDAKKPFVYSEAVGQAMEKMDKAVLELSVRGTPAIYDANFEPVSQYQFLQLDKK